jgi:hypothetical protein
MKHFSKALTNYLADSGTSQTDFSKASSIIPSKLSRLLSDSVLCDRETLDQTLGAVKTNDARREIVAAYIKDNVSPAALLFLQLKEGADPFHELELERLSKKGRLAFNALMRSDYVENVEAILLDLAQAFRLLK